MKENGPRCHRGPEAKLQNSAGNPALLKKAGFSHASGSTSSGNSDSALERLAERAQALAACVTAGKRSFITPVALAYAAAVGMGLTDDDAVQRVPAAAFAPARRAP